jgi:magnesium transporter
MPVRRIRAQRMTTAAKKRSKKTGLPPGSLIHIGEQKTDEIKITIREFGEDQYSETRDASFDQCARIKDEATVTWVNVEGIHHVETLERLGECYGLHPLVLEDILATDQHPKMEDYDNYVYVVVKLFTYDNGNSDSTVIEQFSMIIGSNYILSFLEKETDIFAPIVERIRNNKGRIRKMGADYLGYALLDSIVDRYFVILGSDWSCWRRNWLPIQARPPCK